MFNFSPCDEKAMKGHPISYLLTGTRSIAPKHPRHQTEPAPPLLAIHRLRGLDPCSPLRKTKFRLYCHILLPYFYSKFL